MNELPQSPLSWIVITRQDEKRKKKKEREGRNGKTKWNEFDEMLEKEVSTTLRKFCSPKKRRWFNAQKARREKVKICRKNRAKQRRACTSKIHARRYLLAVITRSRKTRCGSILVLVTPFCIVRQTFTLMQWLGRRVWIVNFGYDKTFGHDDINR